MAYQVNIQAFDGVFALPNAVVDQHIKLCGAASLKALLLIFRHPGKPVGCDVLAKTLGLSVADLKDALNYWVEAGLLQETSAQSIQAENPEVVSDEAVDLFAAFRKLSATEDIVTNPPVSKHQETIVPEAVPSRSTEVRPDGQKITTIYARPRLTRSDIIELSQKDNNIPLLLQEAQQIMGRPLKSPESDVLIHLYVSYNLSPDYILMAMEYCCSIDKRNINYIEKTIASWLEQGVDSHEKAERQISRLTQQNHIEGMVKSAFGIYDRNLIQKEKDYINQWYYQYHFELPLIQQAYERTVEQTGKLSFAYLNRILSDWHEKGITTVQQAMEESGKGGQKKPSAKAQGQDFSTSSFDIDEVENLIQKNFDRV